MDLDSLISKLLSVAEKQGEQRRADRKAELFAQRQQQPQQPTGLSAFAASQEMKNNPRFISEYVNAENEWKNRYGSDISKYFGTEQQYRDYISNNALRSLSAKMDVDRDVQKRRDDIAYADKYNDQFTAREDKERDYRMNQALFDLEKSKVENDKETRRYQTDQQGKAASEARMYETGSRYVQSRMQNDPKLSPDAAWQEYWTGVAKQKAMNDIVKPGGLTDTTPPGSQGQASPTQQQQASAARANPAQQPAMNPRPDAAFPNQKMPSPLSRYADPQMSSTGELPPEVGGKPPMLDYSQQRYYQNTKRRSMFR